MTHAARVWCRPASLASAAGPSVAHPAPGSVGALSKGTLSGSPRFRPRQGGPRLVGHVGRRPAGVLLSKSAVLRPGQVVLLSSRLLPRRRTFAPNPWWGVMFRCGGYMRRHGRHYAWQSCMTCWLCTPPSCMLSTPTALPSDALYNHQPFALFACGFSTIDFLCSRYGRPRPGGRRRGTRWTRRWGGRPPVRGA